MEHTKEPNMPFSMLPSASEQFVSRPPHPSEWDHRVPAPRRPQVVVLREQLAAAMALLEKVRPNTAKMEDSPWYEERAKLRGAIIEANR